MDSFLRQGSRDGDGDVKGDLDPEQAIARIPGWSPQDTVVEKPLEGLTNRSFRVRRGRERFVLRLDAPHTALFGLDREAELAALENAAAAGLGPEVVFAAPGEGILVTRLLGGRVLRRADLEDDELLVEIGSLLRRVHELPRSGRLFDASAAARRYLDALTADAGLHATGQLCLAIIEGAGPPRDTVFCHNDVVAENLVSDAPIRLIDWEYACDNDGAFDLATLVAYHELDRRQAVTLVSGYCAGPTGELLERLEVQTGVCDALHWLWLAVRESLSPEPGQARRLARLRERIVAR
jgi:thiamine kinase-like enzyme